MFRRIFLGVLVLFVAVSVGIAVFFATFDANQYKPEISAIVKDKTGRDLLLAGDLNLSAFPDIAIELGQAELSNLVTFEDENFAKVDKARVIVEFMPLLKQELKIKEITLKGLELNLHIDKNGKSNWSDFVGEANVQEEETKAGKIIGQMLAGMTVAGVSLEDSKVSWTDESTGTKLLVEPLNLKTGEFKPGKSLPISVDLGLVQNRPAMNLKLKGGTTVTLDTDQQQIALDNADITATLNGEIVSGGTVVTHLMGDVSGNLSTQSFTIPNLVFNTDVSGKTLQGGTLAAKLKGNARFDGQAQSLQIDNLNLATDLQGGAVGNSHLKNTVNGNLNFNVATQSLQLTGMNLVSAINGELLQGGSLNAQTTGNTAFDVAAQKLSIKGMKSAIDMSGGALKDGALQSHINGNTVVDLASTHLSISNLDVKSDIQMSSIPGGKAKQTAQGKVDLNWGSKDGNADFSSLMVSLAELQISGMAKVNNLLNEPTVTGHFKSNTFNLRNVLGRLGMDAPQTRKTGLLGASSIDLNIVASPSNLDISSIKAKIDDVTINGKLSIKNLSNPAITSDISINAINVDNYLPPETAGEQAAPAGAAALLPLALLRNLNVDGQLNIGSMVYSKIRMSDVGVTVNASNGIVQANPVKANLYKGKYQGSIKLDTASTAPTLSMDHSLKGLRSDGLLQDVMDDKLVTGTLNLNSQLNTRGNSVNAVKQNLNGKVNMEFLDGTIRDSNFAKETELVVQVFERRKQTDSGKTEVKFTKFSGDWDVVNGIFKTDSLQMLAPHFQVRGDGDADIVKEYLDFNLKVGRKEKEGRKNIFAPLRIFGPFADLQYKLDVAGLLKSIAQEDIDKAKEEARQKLKEEEDRAKQKLKEKEDELKAELERKKQAELDRLKAKADEEKKRLEAKLARELDLKKQEELKRLEDEAKQKLEDELKDKLKNDVEDKLKNKLKDLFRTNWQ